MVEKAESSGLPLFLFVPFIFIVIGLFAFGVYLNKNQKTFQQLLTKNSEKIAKVEQNIQALSVDMENNKNIIEEKNRKIIELEHSVDTVNNTTSETNKKIDTFIKENKNLFNKLSKKIDDNTNIQNKKITEQDKRLEELKKQLGSIESKISTETSSNILDSKSSNSNDIVAVNNSNDIQKDISDIKNQLNNKTDGVMTRLVELETKIGSKKESGVVNSTNEKTTNIDKTDNVDNSTATEYDKKIDTINRQVAKLSSDIATINTYVEDLKKGYDDIRNLSIRVDNMEKSGSSK